jgi:hypothetical protein
MEVVLRRRPKRGAPTEAAPRTTFQCVRCGEEHEGPPRSYVVAEPSGWAITQDPASRRWGEIYEEQAILHGPDGEEGWFLRGNIDLPVDDGGQFNYTVWVSLSHENFQRAGELWVDPRRVDEPPYFGWLMVELPGYPSTFHLKANVHSRPPGQRPFVELEPTDHPLAVEQRNGITLKRIEELAAIALHPEQP